MGKDIKFAGLILVGILSATVAVLFLGYFALAFLAWLISDPLDILPESETPEYRISDYSIESAERCEEQGGFPSFSWWNGEFEECLPSLNPAP